MLDDNSRDLQNPARADASPPTNDPPRSDGSEPSETNRSASDLRADGSTTWIGLTAFQRDCLEAVARCDHTSETTDERALTYALEYAYPYIDYAQLQSNLATLVAHELVTSRRVDESTSEYTPTDAGRALVARRATQLAAACGVAIGDRSAAELEALEDAAAPPKCERDG
ncbi:PadR family transcriptional regulator [Natrinema salsiterrestre]|uniref:PadR family transcriptional regulator n=1 Tax=Natrinema salsiterrestre TaxID=2950540 RepID=A0A9Q4Q0U7_9EURY|nr:PadR family transcriptional regulator [Natrinema salsiterrestre]MDF9747030.1 PadR family transcriptional regulator [Natrinema salsiterrestre]